MCHKATYLTRREAAGQARWMRRHSVTQRPYRCRDCGLWHLTTQHSRGKRAQYRQERMRHP